MASRFRPWLFVLAWASVIFSFSTGSFSEGHTGTIFLPLYRFLLPHASEAQIEFLHHLTRKGAHLFEYFVFGWLLLIAVRGEERGWKLRWALLALLLAAAYGASDEFHQIFVAGRGPSARDALLDTLGAAIGLAIAGLVARRHPTAAKSPGPGPA